jgi:hypothetical protein
VLLREIFTEATIPSPKKKLGRTFNHLEDLVFFHGSKGALEAIAHLKEINKSSGSVRMKWDGAPQIYWGRDENGTFVLAGHNGWSRGAKGTSPEEVYDFIANQSGNPKTPQEKQEREVFAKQFASLYPLFESATPENFKGYVYADALFLRRPALDAKGVYNFYPNPKSQTGYHVSADSELGQKISQADVMVVGHATFDEFGADDSAQKPKDSFEEFNSNPALIVLGPYYTQMQPQIEISQVLSVEKYLAQHAQEIDGFLAPLPGVSGFKDMMYRYVNTMSKQKQLQNIGINFMNWVQTSGVVSATQQVKIQERAQQYPSALPVIFKIMTDIMALKNNIIDQLDSEPGEIIASNSEGWVRYADKGKQFGNVKFVPRHRWTP